MVSQTGAASPVTSEGRRGDVPPLLPLGRLFLVHLLHPLISLLYISIAAKARPLGPMGPTLLKPLKKRPH